MKRQNPQAQQLKNAKLTKDFELWSQDMLNAKDADWVIDGSYFMEVNLKKSSADYATQAQVAAALIQLINNTARYIKARSRDKITASMRGFVS